MKKVVWIMVHLCLCAVFLAGCGEAKVPDVIQAPTVAVAKEGTVEVWLLGDFDKNYYSVSELSDMALEEAGRFNAAKQKDSAVQVKKVEAVSDVRVMVSYGFDSCASCEEFLEGQLFFGTVGCDSARCQRRRSLYGNPAAAGERQIFDHYGHEGEHLLSPGCHAYQQRRRGESGRKHQSLHGGGAGVYSAEVGRIAFGPRGRHIKK